MHIDMDYAIYVLANLALLILTVITFWIFLYEEDSKNKNKNLSKKRLKIIENLMLGLIMGEAAIIAFAGYTLVISLL